MMRLTAALLMLGLAAIPLRVLAVSPLAALGLGVVVLGWAGIALRSIGTLVAAATLALIEYALALWSVSAAPDTIGAIGFAVVLLVPLEIADLDRPAGGAPIQRSVIAAHAGRWLIVSAGVAAGAALIARGAAMTALPLPEPVLPALAALGVLGAFPGAVRVTALAGVRGTPPGRGKA